MPPGAAVTCACGADRSRWVYRYFAAGKAHEVPLGLHVPACRMKGGAARDIQLSRAALALLAELPGDRTGERDEHPIDRLAGASGKQI